VPYYNHNDHYADLLLRQVPSHARQALDIGCREGRFTARLAEISPDVTRIDPDKPARTNAPFQFLWDNFLSHDFGEERFDFVSAVASIHHMPFRPALEKMARLIRPGGVLTVLGLYRSTTAVDHIVDVAAVPVNAVLALARPTHAMAAAATDPAMTLAAIRSVSDDALPASSVRRLLLWRYILPWRREAPGGA
jgi:SAM-dependent methyltransferase